MSQDRSEIVCFNKAELPKLIHCGFEELPRLLVSKTFEPFELLVFTTLLFCSKYYSYLRRADRMLDRLAGPISSRLLRLEAH